MEIAIIGTGNIGGALARHWHAAGHRLWFGARDPSAPGARAVAEEVGAQLGTPAEVLEAAGVVVLAIPGTAVVETARELADGLTGKILVVPANQLRGGPPNLAQAVAEAAPGSHVVRAFNTIAAETLAAGQIDGEPVDMFYVADDDADGAAVALISDCGLRPVRVGGVAEGHLLDMLFSLWGALAWGAGRGRGIAFALRGA